MSSSNPKNLLNDTVKLLGFKADRNTALWGFYAFQGVLAGIALNDIWQFLSLPGNNQAVTRADGTKVGDFDMDFIYQAGIGGLLIASEVLFGIKHASSCWWWTCTWCKMGEPLRKRSVHW